MPLPRPSWRQLGTILIVGALTTIALAWGCVVWSPISLRSIEHHADWPATPREATEDYAYIVHHHRSPGVREWDSVEGGPAWRFDVLMQHRLKAGWPFLALERIQERRRDDYPMETIGNRRPAMWREGLWLGPLAGLLRSERASLPIVPLWPGFLLNTVLFAAAAGSILAVLAERRRSGRWGAWIRRRWRRAVALGMLAAALSAGAGMAACTFAVPEPEFLDATPPSAWPVAMTADCPPPQSEWRFEGAMVSHRTLSATTGSDDTPTHTRHTSVISSGGWPLTSMFTERAVTELWHAGSGLRMRRDEITRPWPIAGIRFRGANGAPTPVCPLWPGFLANAALYWAVLALASAVFSHFVQARRLGRGACAGCGYSLTGLTTGSPCPECGTRPDRPPPARPTSSPPS